MDRTCEELLQETENKNVLKIKNKIRIEARNKAKLVNVHVTMRGRKKMSGIKSLQKLKIKEKKKEKEKDSYKCKTSVIYLFIFFIIHGNWNFQTHKLPFSKKQIASIFLSFYLFFFSNLNEKKEGGGNTV